MSNKNNNEQPAVWPPPVGSGNPSAMTGGRTREEALVTFKGVFALGFLCGIVLSLLCAISLFLIFVKVGGAQMLYGASPGARMTAFYIENVVKILVLGVPVLFYAWLRRRSPSYALGLLIGGLFINLLFVLWHIFSLQLNTTV